MAHDPTTAGDRVPQRLQERLGGIGRRVLPAEDAHQVSVGHPLKAMLRDDQQTGVGADRSGFHGDDGEVVYREAVGGAVETEDLRHDAETEGPHPVVDHSDHVVQHAGQCGRYLAIEGSSATRRHADGDRSWSPVAESGHRRTEKDHGVDTIGAGA